MSYIKDNNMFTIVYVNKETIEIKQDYLYELEDRTTINDQLKKRLFNRKSLQIFRSINTQTKKKSDFLLS